ncbi:MAG: class I SAM-dependent methyltransferase [Anaerolineae bacterium]
MSDAPRPQFDPDFPAFAASHGLDDWEGWWSPYDDATYAAVLDAVATENTVLDIGAGDLRLSLRLAARARRVYAVEVNPRLVADALARAGYALPRNLVVVCGNALDISVPPDVTAAVLLMRHCRHFRAYVDRLRAVGCRRLITNARWGMGVEIVGLGPGAAWETFAGGWYACLCGAVGYKGEDAADEPQDAVTVETCPACARVAG